MEKAWMFLSMTPSSSPMIFYFDSVIFTRIENDSIYNHHTFLLAYFALGKKHGLTLGVNDL